MGAGTSSVSSDNPDLTVAEHSKIQGQYAAFAVKSTSDALKPLRPPTQPASDIEAVRKSILATAAKNLHLIQVALTTILIALLIYVLVPAPYAHGIAFLTLCVGTAIGIYLTKL
jgi:hypothetical protein